MAEEEGRKEKDAKEVATGPPDAEGQGADRITGLAGPGDASGGGADRAAGLADPGDASREGADRATGLAGPGGVRGGGTTTVRDPLDVGDQEGIEHDTGRGMGATLAPQEQQASFVFTGPPSTRHDLGPSTAHSAQQGMGTSSRPSGHQMAGHSGSHPQQRASGSSTGPSVDPGLALASAPLDAGNVAHGMDMSAEDEAV